MGRIETMLAAVAMAMAGYAGEIRVGAVNWDCSVPRGTYFGNAVARSLGPEKWRDRTPFYAREIGKDQIEIKYRTLEEYEREMQYAIDAGLDYFAYCWYDQNPGLGKPEGHEKCDACGHLQEITRARRLHAKSALREKLHLCAIMVAAHPYSDQELTELVLEMQEPWYERVGERPLVFIGYTQKPDMARRIRALCKELGTRDPYLVWMNPPEKISEEMRGLFDALSAYACCKFGTFMDINRQNIEMNDGWAKTGMKVLPHYTTGWDARPRVENPVPWCDCYPAGRAYAAAKSEAEFTASARNMKEWMSANAEAVDNDHVLVFAWNEFEEGGWLCPNIGESEELRVKSEELRRVDSGSVSHKGHKERKEGGVDTRRVEWFRKAAEILKGEAVKPVSVRVRDTESGPRLYVDGEAVRPRFYFGSPTCLCNIGDVKPVSFTLPFVAMETTDRGSVTLEVWEGENAMEWFDARLIDITSGVTNAIPGYVKEKKYHQGGLRLEKGHEYHYVVMTKAEHYRTYYSYKAEYETEGGETVKLPFPYGDTLGRATELGAEAGVDIVSFSTDSSWGCQDWWSEDGGTNGYAKIDAMMQKLIGINPNVLLIPRVMANAPSWFYRKYPEARMKFASGVTIDMPSVSHRPYRKQACEELEKLGRYLRRKYPRNFAGLHPGGQNSAEWFYMMSPSGDLSGCDEATREAYRAETGREVPSVEERKRERENARYDAEKDAEVLEFIRFRQREMASFLKEMGEAIRRGTDNELLSLFFYGYTWEIGMCCSGAGETGHYAMQWLLDNAKGAIDGISSPISYSDRNLTGSTAVMSAAETVMRNGFLWILEEDSRTHREDIWDHMALFKPFKDPWITEQILKRDSAVAILRGYGDWWMDLFGRGWHGERETWEVRKELNALDEEMLKRRGRYEPEIAVVMDEESMIRNAYWSHAYMGRPCSRKQYTHCGVTYGQYLKEDFERKRPKGVKLVIYPEEEYRGRKEEVTAEEIQERAVAAGCHAYTAAGKAVIEAAEGWVMVQAAEDGALEIRFRDGTKRTEEFRKGEVRLFKE